MLKNVFLALIGSLLVWVVSSLVPSNSQVKDIDGRVDTIEQLHFELKDNLLEVKKDVREIRNLLLNGACHD